MNYESMVYVYDWLMEEHQPIGIDYQPIRDDDYIEDSMTQHYMKFNKDRQGESRFWNHTFSQAEFVYNSMDHGSTGFPRKLKRIDFVENSNKKYKTAADKKRQEKLFEEEDVMMIYLRKERIPT